jgi:hypothetical protein
MRTLFSSRGGSALPRIDTPVRLKRFAFSLKQNLSPHALKSFISGSVR